MKPWVIQSFVAFDYMNRTLNYELDQRIYNSLYLFTVSLRKFNVTMQAKKENFDFDSEQCNLFHVECLFHMAQCSNLTAAQSSKMSKNCPKRVVFLPLVLWTSKVKVLR